MSRVVIVLVPVPYIFCGDRWNCRCNIKSSVRNVLSRLVAETGCLTKRILLWSTCGKSRSGKRLSDGRVADLRGLGSVSNDKRDRITLNIERAGDHWFLRISMQTAPRSEMFMWYILYKRGEGGVERMNQEVSRFSVPGQEEYFGGRKSNRHSEVLGAQAPLESFATHG